MRYVPAATPARNTGDKRRGDHDEPAAMVDDAALDEAADRVERVGVRVADTHAFHSTASNSKRYSNRGEVQLCHRMLPDSVLR